MTALADELRAVPPYYTVRTFSHRHADVVHALGIWCSALARDDCRGIVVNVLGVTGLSARGLLYLGTAFSDADRMTAIYTVGGEVAEETFLREMRALYQRLRELCRPNA